MIILDELKFNSLKELYERITPALKTKKNELHHQGKKYITEKDIWEFLCLNYWKDSAYLSLHEMVDDVLNLDDESLDDFIQNNIYNNKKEHEND